LRAVFAESGNIAEDMEVELRGVGTVMFDNYIFTVNHVTDFEASGMPARLLQTLKGQTSYLVLHDGKEVELESVVSDSAVDVAMFRIPDGTQVNSLPYPTGRTEDLQIGNIVYLIGNPQLRGWNYREGIVSQLEPIEGFGPGASIFFISAPINRGDSGALVVAVRDGEYEVIGFPRGKFTREEATGFVVGISQYMTTVLEALGQDEELRKRHLDLYNNLLSKYR